MNDLDSFVFIDIESGSQVGTARSIQDVEDAIRDQHEDDPDRLHDLLIFPVKNGKRQKESWTGIDVFRGVFKKALQSSHPPLIGNKYLLAVAGLKQGRTLQMRPVGQSMTPKIKSGQLITIEPLGDREPKKGDIVLAKVRGHYYIHLVSAIKHGEVQISNNHGHVNGWTPLHQVFGIVTNIT